MERPVRSGFPMLAAMATLLSLAGAPPVLAHHPGAGIDRFMGDKERYFEAVDRPAPGFKLKDADGAPVTLADYSDKVLVLHFIYAGCPDVCPLHTEKLARIQEMIAPSPMKDVVRFVSITTDPTQDTPALMKEYGRNHGLDPASWRFLTTRSGQDEAATRVLAEDFGHKFVKTDGGLQMHSVVTHVIDRNGRWAANFHGLRFEPVNMVLYLNGLINNHARPDGGSGSGWWRRLKDVF